jgi:D-alanine-D-alanine ligase
VTAATAATVTWTRPVVVKPVAAGSSRGVSLVRAPEQLAPALAAALSLDSRALVEDLVVGREIDVAVLRRADGSTLVAPALEIVVDGVFDFEAKYGGAADFRLPAQLDEVESKALEDAALAMAEALGCAGVVRVDFFLTEDGPVLNEVNTMPGMTEQSQVPRMFAAAGLPYPALLDELVRGATR